MMPAAPSRLVTSPEVLLTTTPDYHDAYELRRRTSTMTGAAVDDLHRRISAVRITGRGDSRPPLLWRLLPQGVPGFVFMLLGREGARVRHAG